MEPRSCRSEGRRRVGSGEQTTPGREGEIAGSSDLLAFKTRKPASAVSDQRYQTLQV